MDKRTRQMIMFVGAILMIWVIFVGIRNGNNENDKQKQQQQTTPTTPTTIKSMLPPADEKKKKMKENKVVMIVGAGMTGAVAARLLAENGYRVKVIDKRNHIGGNCFDRVKKESNVMAHVYGAHLFHTDDEKVYEFLGRFTTWVPYEHRVMANVMTHTGRSAEKRIEVPMPPTRESINKVFGVELKDRKELEEWLEEQRKDPETCEEGKRERERTIEDELLETVGEGVTEVFYRHYTEKQWGVALREVPPATVKRVFPAVRLTDDTRYFMNQKYQAMPMDGYTAMFVSMLGHPNITVSLGERWIYPSGIALMGNGDGKEEKLDYEEYDHLVFTGPIDEFFEIK